MKTIYIFISVLLFLSCSHQESDKKNKTQSENVAKDPELINDLENPDIDINPDSAIKLITTFMDSCKKLPYSKQNLDDFMYPINNENISYKYHQYIENYKVDSFKYPFVYVSIIPKLSKFEIESDWTKILSFKIKTNGHELKIEPSIMNRVYRSYWWSKEIKELVDKKADYSNKWFNANIDSTVNFVEITENINQTDLSEVFTPKYGGIRNGIFGKKYQRIQIYISSIKKSKDKYQVTGKSKLKENVESFQGFIKPRLALKYDNEGLDMSPILILSDYEFEEKEGVFKGVLASFCFIDSNVYKLDTRASVSDDYFNNGFVGIWRSNKTGNEYKCIWADGRLPYTNDFDIGTGEFYPNEKYIKNGWESYVKSLNNDSEAIKIENENREKLKNTP
jgi:hypothetical protein